MRRLLLASLLLSMAAAPATARDRLADRSAPAGTNDRSGPPTPREAADADRSRARLLVQQREAQARARQAGAEEQRLAAARVEAAARLRTVETQLDTRATEVEALAAQRDEAATRLAERAAAVAPLLPLMQRLALFPSETLLAVPAEPEQTLRGLVVLRGLARRLEQEAAGLRSDQAALTARQAAVSQALTGLRTIRAEQAEQSINLDQQIAIARAQRLQADDAGADASRAAAAEAARADSLRAALANLEAARARAEAQAREDAARAERRRQDTQAIAARQREATMARPSNPAPEPRGQLTQPVAGSVMRAYGDSTDAGPSNGISYRPAPSARVVAPCGGRVRFAGPFRSYGALVILDCGGGYAFVLAGLGRLDVAAGGSVLAGEPMGTMPDWNAAAAGPRPALYLELRRDGQAVNPAPFLSGRG